MSELKSELTIYIPSPDASEVSDGLRMLTKTIHESGLASGEQDGIFGGEWGYGANFENGTFMMHRFCWCERDDCFWCGKDCGCKSRYGYFLDGKEISKNAYEKWLKTIKKPLPWEAAGCGGRNAYGSPAFVAAQREFDAYIEERNKRSGRIFGKVVHACDNPMFYDQHDDIWSVYAPEPYPHSAPHFWHKESGSRVWWYKYIGRENIISLTRPWAGVLHDCLRSLEVTPK